MHRFRAASKRDARFHSNKAIKLWSLSSAGLTSRTKLKRKLNVTGQKEAAVLAEWIQRLGGRTALLHVWDFFGCTIKAAKMSFSGIHCKSSALSWPKMTLKSALKSAKPSLQGERRHQNPYHNSNSLNYSSQPWFLVRESTF